MILINTDICPIRGYGFGMSLGQGEDFHQGWNAEAKFYNLWQQNGDGYDLGDGNGDGTGRASEDHDQTTCLATLLIIHQNL